MLFMLLGLNCLYEPFHFSAVQLVEDVNHQRELFLVNYTEIGNGHGVAAELQMEHEQFAAESLVSGHDARDGVRVRLSRLCIPCDLEIILTSALSQLGL